MEFTARLGKPVDEAMLLFQLRRIQAKAEVHAPPKGGDDVQLMGEVPDDRVDALLDAMGRLKGALHVADKHYRLTGEGAEEAASIEEAEVKMGGPFTIPGTTRAAWSFGGALKDHIIQVLYFDGERMAAHEVHAKTGGAIDRVMQSLKSLEADRAVRRFREPREGGGSREVYGLAGDVRGRIDSQLGRTTDPAQ